MKEKIAKSARLNGGFTLVEVAVVMVIGSIITVMLMNNVTTSLKNARMKETRNKLEMVQNELELFLERNGRYPCPADPGLRFDTQNFGREGTCAGTVSQGALPVRTLNLPDDILFDSYKNRFTYAVTSALGNAQTYTTAGGSITVTDSNGNDIMDNAHYVIVSHGENGAGARTAMTGALKSACDANVPALEQENCDGDDTFSSTLITADSGNNTDFDDRVLARGAPTFRQAVPSGALITFDLTTCPPGWQSVSGAPGSLVCRKP